MQNFQRRPSTTTQYTAPVPVQMRQALQVQPPRQESGVVSGGTEPPAWMLEPDAIRSEDPVARNEARRALMGITRVLEVAADRKRNVDAIMAELLRETRLLRAQRRQRRLRQALYLIVVVSVVLLTRGHFAFYWWLFFTGGGAVAADGAVGKRRQATHALSQADEPRSVGVLALAMSEEDNYVREAASRALYRLLPRVRASDATYIDAEQMTALLSLAEGDDPGMQIPLLKALEQIGDARALHVVEGLAVTGSPEVRRKALECLPYLQERSQRAWEQTTLLRGVIAPPAAAQPEQLLRPAAGSQSNDAPEQLLRATSGQAEQ